MNYLTTFILFSLFGMALIVFAFIIVEYGKEVSDQAAQYEKIYDKIQRVMTYDICEANYEWIKRLLVELRECKYKNKEHTEVLTTQFYRQYQEVIKNEV